MSGQSKSKRRSKEVPRVPLALREGGTLICQFPLFNRVGRSVYRVLSTRLLKELSSRFPQVEASIIGGSVERCVPGLSDIDLLLVLPDSWAHTENPDLRKLKAWYGHARARNPLLGECFVIEQSRMVEGLSLFPEKWETVGRSGSKIFEFELEARRRLHLALFHYRWAGDAFRLRASRRAQSVWTLALRRQLSKVIALAENRSRPGLSVGSLAELYSRAFAALENLSQDVLHSHPSEFCESQTPRRSFAQEKLLTEAWLQASSLSDETRCYLTPAPFVLGLRDSDPERLKTVFGRLLNEKNTFSIPLVLLGPSSVQALLAGWGQFYPDENLDWIVDNKIGLKNESARLEFQRGLPLLRWGRYFRDEIDRC